MAGGREDGGCLQTRGFGEETVDRLCVRVCVRGGEQFVCPFSAVQMHVRWPYAAYRQMTETIHVEMCCCVSALASPTSLPCLPPCLLPSLDL